jgi:diguanylate cyclase (GGDEF)-like protein
VSHLRRSLEAMVAAARIRNWPLWQLQPWLAGYVVIVVACYVFALAAGVAVTSFRVHDAEWFAALVLFGIISIELTRRHGEATEFSKDVHGVWHIPVALLLPPIYSMIAPSLKVLLTQWRVTPKPLHRRAFTAASQGLAYGAASLIFHAITPHLPPLSQGLEKHWLCWAAVAAFAVLLESAANTAVITVAVRGADPSFNLRSRQFARDPLYNDLAEQTAGTLLAVMLAATGTWLLMLLALPLVTLLQRSLRHAQLTDAARLDAKTGLLNAITWQREARAEIIRAARTGTPVTLALLDIDHFKQVNDTYGHLTGDSILIALASTMQRQVRDYDIVGRFGGEEFTVLFPHTDIADAQQIAERLRTSAAQILLGPARITVSIGVATLDSAKADLNELIAAADAALYHAKANGRDQVCVLPEVQIPRQYSGPASSPHRETLG